MFSRSIFLKCCKLLKDYLFKLFILFISLSRVVIIIVSFLHLQVLVMFYGILLLVFLRVVNRCLSCVSTQFFSQTYVLLKVCPW